MKIKFKSMIVALMFCMVLGVGIKANAATLKIKTISEFVYTVNQNATFKLPVDICAIMNNNTKKVYLIKWGVTKVSTAKLGKQVIYGTVIGYAKRSIKCIYLNFIVA